MPKMNVSQAGAERRKPLRMRFTQTAVDKLNPPGEGRIDIWDTQLPGFGLRVSAPRPGQPARKTWQTMYRVNGKLKRETLGTLATIPKVDEARAKARESMTKAGQGVDPVAERKVAEQHTVDAVLNIYLAKANPEQRQRRDHQQADAVGKRKVGKRKAGGWMRPAYYKETKRALDRDVRPVLGQRDIRDVTRRDVRGLLDAIVNRGSPVHANHVLSYLRAACNWAIANDYIEDNPCDGIEQPAEIIERDHTLGDDEIRPFWLGCERIGYPFGPLFQLLLLTGQRRGELAGGTWPEFDLSKALWTLPGARTKNGKAHLVHLAPQAIEIVGALPRIDHDSLLFTTTGETPVSGWGVARARLVKAMTEIAGNAPADFNLHDLRRTCATGMAGLGIAPHVVEKILNHSTGKISGVAAVYNRFEYLDERKLALDAWARHVEGLVKPRRGATVTPLRR